MEEGAKVYDRKFHTGRLEKTAYKVLAVASLEAYKSVKGAYPASVCDIGCSSGALLYRMKEIMPALVTDGYDYSVHPDDIVFTGAYQEVDLNKYDGTAKGSYDLLVSQEVFEHIEPENTDRALQIFNDLSKPGTLLVFGAARPYQKGRHHVNCRKKKNWIKLLECRGWAYDLTAHLAYNGIIDRDDTIHLRCRYYRRNTICLIRT